jgi:two-component system LytT family response regulator
MLNILIIDDEQNVRDVVATILTKRCANVHVVGFAESVKSGIEAIEKFKPDLVLLDIHLQDGTGFDLLNKINEINFKVIFITAYEEYAVKAFKFSAVDYILKPVNSIELAEAVNKVAATKLAADPGVTVLKTNHNSVKESKKIVLKTLDSIYAVNIKDIVRCESDTGYTTFHMENGESIMVSTTLKDYDELLADFGFFRIHQSHLINMDFFTKYKKTDGGFAVMKNGAEIPVSMRKKDAFLEAISKF